MKKYLAGATLATLGFMGLKKAYKTGYIKGVKTCSLLLQTAIDTQEIVEKKYEKKEEES